MRGLGTRHEGGGRHGAATAQKPGWNVVLRESLVLVREHRRRLLLGLLLLGLSRIAALVPPASAGWLLDKVAGALISARVKNGAYAYGGAAGEHQTGLKDAAGRMPVCEGVLLQLGRSDLDKVRFALQNFWDNVDRLEGVRRNDFHSDGELGGFFFFHAVFHAAETVGLLPEAERAPHWQRFLKLLREIPELDGSFLDSHELGRSYGTAMALLTLRAATR